jgi:hypothetical protein
MVLFYRLTHIIVLTFSKFKKKKIIKIITNIGRRDSCHQLNNYKYWHFHPNVYSHCVFLLTRTEKCLSNSEIHDINSWYNYSLHLPSTDLALVQKGVLYRGNKIYNCLPSNIKVLSNDDEHFKSTLKSYLIEQAFYSLDEYYQSAFHWSWFFIDFWFSCRFNNYKICDLFMLLIVSCFTYVYCVMTNALNTFVYSCVWFHICKDLTEGEINWIIYHIYNIVRVC